MIKLDRATVHRLADGAGAPARPEGVHGAAAKGAAAGGDALAGARLPAVRRITLDAAEARLALRRSRHALRTPLRPSRATREAAGHGAPRRGALSASSARRGAGSQGLAEVGGGERLDGFQEEEGLLQRALGESFERLWGGLAGAVPDGLLEAIVPYWLLLAPIDAVQEAMPGGGPHLAKRPALSGAQAARREEGIGEIIESLQMQLASSARREGVRAIPGELLVLEQRLCLEEEKFLCAKLRSEYRGRLYDIVAKRRSHPQQEAVVSLPAGEPSDSSVCITAAAPASGRAGPISAERGCGGGTSDENDGAENLR